MADDEFAEFDIDEMTFDAILEHGEPVELVERPRAFTVSPDSFHFRIADNATQEPHDLAVRLESYGVLAQG
jgi:hypothetical protein